MDTVRKHSAVLDLPMENVLELAVTHDDLTRHENDSQEYQKLEAIIQALIHDDLPNPQGSAKRRKSKSLKRQVIDEGEAKALIEPHFPINKDVPAHMLTITHEYCESSGWYYHNIQEENFSLRELDERIQSDCERPKISIPDNSHQYQKSYDNAAEMVKPLQSSNLGVETDSASHNHVRKDPDASFEKEIIKAELERVYEELRRVKSEPREKAQTRNYTGWRDPWSTYQPSYETESGESFAFEDRQKQRSLLELRLRRLLLMEKLAEMIDNIRILSDSGGHDKGESNDQRKEQQEFEEGDQEEDNGKETQQEEVQQARVENQREEYCQTDDKGQQQNKRESKPRRDMEQALDSGDEFRTTLGAHSGSGGHNGSEIGLSRSSIDGEEHRISSLGTSPAAARLPQTYQHTYVLPALKDRYLAYRSGNGDHGEFGSETKDTEFNDRDTEYSYEVLNTDFDSDSDSGTLGYEIDGGFTWIHVPGNDRSWVEVLIKSSAYFLAARLLT